MEAATRATVASDAPVLPGGGQTLGPFAAEVAPKAKNPHHTNGEVNEASIAETISRSDTATKSQVNGTDDEASSGLVAETPNPLAGNGIMGDAVLGKWDGNFATAPIPLTDSHPEGQAAEYVKNGHLDDVWPPATKLKRRLENTKDLIVCPGVYDGFSARIAISVGFDALYMV